MMNCDSICVHAVIALCPNNNEVHIYKLVEENWERIHVLQKVFDIKFIPALTFFVFVFALEWLTYAFCCSNFCPQFLISYWWYSCPFFSFFLFFFFLLHLFSWLMKVTIQFFERRLVSDLSLSHGSCWHTSKSLYENLKNVFNSRI